MRITTENTFHITEQPKEFCPLIDEIIEKINKQKEDAFVNTDMFQDNLSVDDEILNFPYIETPYKFIDKLESESNKVLTWANGWIKLFEMAMEKETDPNIKKQLNDLYVDFDEVYEKAKKDFSNYLKIFENGISDLETSEYNHNSLVDAYNSTCYEHSHIDSDIVDKINEQYEELTTIYKNILEESNVCINALEGIRETVADFRMFTNSKIKMNAKVQLTRIEDDVWISYMNWNMGENERKNYFDLVEDSSKLGLRII